MEPSKIKLELFRKIDSLDDQKLKKLYHPIVNLLESTETYKPSSSEKDAIDQALDQSQEGNSHTHQEVMKEAKRKYPNLDFNE
jgi:predicted transcriptional regulator